MTLSSKQPTKAARQSFGATTSYQKVVWQSTSYQKVVWQSTSYQKTELGNLTPSSWTGSHTQLGSSCKTSCTDFLGFVSWNCLDVYYVSPRTHKIHRVETLIFAGFVQPLKRIAYWKCFLTVGAWKHLHWLTGIANFAGRTTKQLIKVELNRIEFLHVSNRLWWCLETTSICIESTCMETTLYRNDRTHS